ncbi:MAG: hypothetical protein HZB56_22690 [Deltaproteobacteria bacterium]|nr:hypothetical protein [Deltaproteobacteria bacterium]
MLQQLNPDARTLADFMSELSEEAYSAGWMDGLEFDLWKALIGGPRTYGRLEITDEQLARLSELSEAAKGWIVFDDVEEETLVPLDEWKQRFERWLQR